MRGRRRPALVGALVVLGLLAAAATALARPAGPRDNPRLAPGASVTVTEVGFGARAAVTIGLVGDHLLGRVPADAGGRVTYRFRVPAHIPDGQHALVFAGPPAHVPRPTDTGNVDVEVPLVRHWRFRTPGGRGGGASAPASGPASSGVAGASSEPGAHSGGTSATGADVLVPLDLALAALVAGAALVLAARRRRH